MDRDKDLIITDYKACGSYQVTSAHLKGLLFWYLTIICPYFLVNNQAECASRRHTFCQVKTDPQTVLIGSACSFCHLFGPISSLLSEDPTRPRSLLYWLERMNGWVRQMSGWMSEDYGGSRSAPRSTDLKHPSSVCVSVRVRHLTWFLSWMLQDYTTQHGLQTYLFLFSFFDFPDEPSSVSEETLLCTYAFFLYYYLSNRDVISFQPDVCYCNTFTGKGDLKKNN